jgi:hypothetical protein
MEQSPETIEEQMDLSLFPNKRPSDHTSARDTKILSIISDAETLIRRVLRFSSMRNVVLGIHNQQDALFTSVKALSPTYDNMSQDGVSEDGGNSAGRRRSILLDSNNKDGTNRTPRGVLQASVSLSGPVPEEHNGIDGTFGGHDVHADTSPYQDAVTSKPQGLRCYPCVCNLPIFMYTHMFIYTYIHTYMLYLYERQYGRNAKKSMPTT